MSASMPPRLAATGCAGPITFCNRGKQMFFERYDPLKQEMVCILAPDGSCNETLRPALDDQQVRQIYRQMWLLRTYDRKAVSLQRQGRFGTYAQMEGQEACMVASPLPLQPQDWMVASYRETGAMWMHGVPLKLLSLYWMGNEFGSQMPPDVRVLPVSIPVGTHPLHAVGLAYAGKYRQDDSIAVTYFGDGATSEGDVHEAMNMAGVFQLPCIFVCQNNQYAISLPRHRQTASPTIAQKALAYGFPGILVDGNDIFAVYAVMREAVQRARRGHGASLIEAYTYRIGAHTTADDPTKYRDDAELQEWRGRDPLLRVQRYLQQRGQWSEAWEQQTLAECTAEVEQAMAEAAAVPPPPPQDMFRYMYATMTPQLSEQEAMLLASLHRKGESHGTAHAR